MIAARVVVVAPDELAALVHEAVAAALGTRLQSDELVPLAAAGVPVRTLRKAIRAGELAASKAGRSYVVERAALREWLAARRVTPKAKPKPVETEADRAIARARRSGALRPVRGRAA